MSSERVVFEVAGTTRIDGEVTAWSVRSRDGSPVGVALGPLPTKSTAVELSGVIGRALERHGILAQAVIHREDGTIEEERTYGEDPVRSPG